MSFRRFVNLVSSDRLKLVYTLRRIDMSRFFLPIPTITNGTIMKQQQQQDSASCSLPDPVINFYSPQDLNGCGDMDFMHVDDKVVATDGTGGAFIYDTGKHAVRSLPGSHAQLQKFTNSLAIGSDLYVIDRFKVGTGNRSFQALVYTPPTPAKQGNWHWRALPPPPPAPPCVRQLDDRTKIDSCAATADGLRIWMSASGELGAAVKSKISCTHLFDTRVLVWTKQPADWVLPFTGSAHYVPELQKLWFGISSGDHGSAFCAADLATASMSRPPMLRVVFDDHMAMAAGVPEERLISAHAVYLGSGRFCIARFFSVLVKIPDDDDDPFSYDENFLVLAGVEVVSGGDGKLSLVKHHSERYMFLDHESHWVL